MTNSFIAFLVLLGFAANSYALQGTGTLETRIGKLEFQQGYPSQKSVEALYDEIDFQRACQAYLWGNGT